MIPKETVEKILAAANIKEVIEDFVPLTKQGASYYGKCPKCDKSGKGKGLMVTPGKGIFKCFSCAWGGKSPVNFLMDSQNKDYPESLKYLADKFHIIYEDVAEPKGPQKKGGKKQETYRDRQLKASGLSDADQKATVVVDEKTTKIVDVFQSGTLDQYGNIVPGDDMIIYYYDLLGNPTMYQPPKPNRRKHLYRVRWQNPDLHLDKNEKPVKYKSPFGSGSHLYIPQAIRNAYADGRVISRLFIQEGEKKAEKASKHGMLSVGIMGINNIGQQNKLPYELQLIVQKCHVKEVIFVLDSDWDHLSDHLDPTKPVESRPKSFFTAVRNFRDYFRTFNNLGIFIETYFATIKSEKDKGIDDLLTMTLKGNEKELLDDFNFCTNEKSGEGKHVNCNKITTETDGKILEYWKLNRLEDFCEKYHDTLIELKEFTYGKHRWKFDETGKPVLSQPLLDDETFWSMETWETKAGVKTRYSFDYENAYNFLRNRGYGRIMMASGVYMFANVLNRVVTIVEAYEIKDFVMQLAKEICPKDIRNMLYRGGKMYFGPDSMGNLDFFYPTFEVADKNYQNLFFKDKYVKITAETIDIKPLTDMQNYVWSDKIKDFDFQLLQEKQPFMEFSQITDEVLEKMRSSGRDTEGLEIHKGKWSSDLSETAMKSHFVNFLIHTSDFYWREAVDEHFDPETGKYSRTLKKENKQSMEEQLETSLHFISKVTAIGYLLHKYRNSSCEKAVIAEDGKMGEVGDSNGRTGKSLIGKAIGKIIPQVVINGKNSKLTEDQFLFEEVTEKTDNIFIDDVRANVDFEFFFPIITGMMTINAKAEKKFTLPESEMPKLYITTNHSINGQTASFKDRQALIAFSDYYNDNYKPLDDFGTNFFDEWDHEQWNLFYNFMVYCLQMYLRHGIISPPTERLERRRLRQFIGEDFLTWADSYYGLSDDIDADYSDSDHINFRIIRQDLYNDFLDKTPNQRKFVQPYRFKKKILAYCQYRGLQFNPAAFDKQGRPGGDDKSGGVEYFTLANRKFSEKYNTL